MHVNEAIDTPFDVFANRAEPDQATFVRAA